MITQYNPNIYPIIILSLPFSFRLSLYNPDRYLRGLGRYLHPAGAFGKAGGGRLNSWLSKNGPCELQSKLLACLGFRDLGFRV